ncbi:MAG: acyl carrier protein [Lachnospiraceae bacterium]|nr:acyl carrier protein [Lachnospiraceae bacterium]
MHKVNSPTEMATVEYKVGSDGKANVWIRKNQEAVTIETEGGDEQTSYEADEVYCTVDPEQVTAAEIEADSDFWFDTLKDAEDRTDASFLSIEAFRGLKKKEVSAACHASIIAGVDVDLSIGTEHFSLAETDQLNLFGKQAQLATGATRLEYHQDGEECKYYSAEDMAGIIQSAMYFVSFQTTYCNSMYTWLEACTKASEMADIVYGSEIPEEYQSEVLKDYINT